MPPHLSLLGTDMQVIREQMQQMTAYTNEPLQEGPDQKAQTCTKLGVNPPFQEGFLGLKASLDLFCFGFFWFQDLE